MKIRAIAAALAGFSLVASSVADRTYFFSFGDSYSKTLWNPDGAHPRDDNPIGNPALPGRTSTGGMSWPGFMVTHFNASSVWLYNFARGGAVVNRRLINRFQSIPETLDLIEQVRLFDAKIRHRPAWIPWTADNSVASIWMGFNDIRQTWSKPDVPNLYSKIIKDYMTQVQVLHSYGIRNIIFLTVAPIYLTPEQRRLSPSRYDRLVWAADLFNEILQEQIPIYAAKMPGINYRVVDTWVPFAKAYQNPTEFGAPNPTCCNGDGVSCLWWNIFHPGVRISELVAAEVAMAWTDEVFHCPQNRKACSNKLLPTPFPSRASIPTSTSMPSAQNTAASADSSAPPILVMEPDEHQQQRLGL